MVKDFPSSMCFNKSLNILVSGEMSPVLRVTQGLDCNMHK